MPKHIPQLHDKEWLLSTYVTKTTRAIAAELGCSQSAVSYALTRLDIQPRQGGRLPGPNELNDKEWLELEYALHTTHQIAKNLGCAQITVWKALHRFGIPLKGHGRRPSEKTQYSQGKDANGVYKKHRRIMENHLGRKLEPNEHVHHIDGNPRNNSLDNLVVLTKSGHHKLHASQEKRARQQRMAGYDYLHFQHTCTRCDTSFKGGNRAKYCVSCR